MNVFILVVWQIVAGGGPYSAWVPIGEFASKKHCEDAAHSLNATGNNHRCLDTGRKAEK